MHLYWTPLQSPCIASSWCVPLWHLPLWGFCLINLCLQDTEGDDKLKKLCEAADLKASSFLETDPELDPPDLPTVEAFLKAEKLESVPV